MTHAHADADPARQAFQEGERLRRGGDTVAARKSYLLAARHARSVGNAELLAEAAFGYGLGAGGVHRAARLDLEHVALLEEGLAALGPAESPLRVRLLARLAEELCFSPESGARASLSAEAVAMAKRLGDDAVLLVAMHARELCRVGPDLPINERLESTAELVKLAIAHGDIEATYLAHMLRELTLVEAGDFVAAGAELRHAELIADHVGMPSLQAWVLTARARRSWLAGCFDVAEEFNAKAMQEALQQGGDPDVANLVIGGQFLAMQLLRADLAPYIPALEDFRDRFPHFVIIRCFLAYAHAEVGNDEKARTLLRETPVSDIPRTSEWLSAMAALSRGASLIQDVETAKALYAELAPCSGRWFSDWASTCQGPVDACLGMLAGTLGLWEEGVAHFERALQQTASAPSPPWQAEAEVAYARMLLARGDRAKAAELLACAQATADELGMAALGERARQLSLKPSPVA